MDGVKLQKKIYRGGEMAARHIGLQYQLVRPASATSPIAISQKKLNAAFSADGKFQKPSAYGKPLFQAVIDGAQVEVGDYLIRDDDTYFIAGMQPLLPILAVKCNRTINVLRAAQPSQIGAQGYGGNTTAGETTLMSGWPASILQGTKGEKSETNLPGDTRMAWWAILLPSFPGVQIENADIIEDDQGMRYVISSAELTDMGWRITAQLAVT